MRQLGMKKRSYNGSVGIRRFETEDAKSLYTAAHESVPELCRWMVWCTPGYSSDDASAFIQRSFALWEQGTRYSFAIYSQQDGELLGSVGLSRVDRIHRFANLGYWVRTSRTGRGAGFAAARLAASFAFADLGLNRVEIIIPVNNLPSIGVARKLGAHCEGILRRRLMLRGRPQDALAYCLLAEEFDGEPLRHEPDFDAQAVQDVKQTDPASVFV
jgi:ribosomal-protein-serine acetyltransferase